MLAERVNASERERGRLNQQKELLAAVDGLALVCVCVFVYWPVCIGCLQPHSQTVSPTAWERGYDKVVCLCDHIFVCHCGNWRL